VLAYLLIGTHCISKGESNNFVTQAVHFKGKR